MFLLEMTLPPHMKLPFTLNIAAIHGYLFGVVATPLTMRPNLLMFDSPQPVKVVK